MTKLIGFFVPLLMMGLAHAQKEEMAEVVLPEPNYVGISIFLILMGGVVAYYVWKIMRNKE